MQLHFSIDTATVLMGGVIILFALSLAAAAVVHAWCQGPVQDDD